MRRVEGPRIVGRVRTDLDIEEIVHQVVGHMGEDDPDEGQHEEPTVEAGLSHREQGGDGTGGQCHREHRGPRQHQPPAHEVERPVLGRVGGAQDFGPARQPPPDSLAYRSSTSIPTLSTRHPRRRARRRGTGSERSGTVDAGVRGTDEVRAGRRGVRTSPRRRARRPVGRPTPCTDWDVHAVRLARDRHAPSVWSRP